MGQHVYRLKSLADDELLAGLSRIVGRRNQITAEFLAYLAELDERQIFLDLGFASLFEYCVEALGLCESTAGRHIAAARVCRSHPEVFGLVASGALHASALSLLRKHLTPENAEELFELCKRRSARKVEQLLAARFPRPDVRDLVRRLPAQRGRTPDVGSGLEKVPPGEPRRELVVESPRELPVESRRGLTRELSVEPTRELAVEPTRELSVQSRRELPVESQRQQAVERQQAFVDPRSREPSTALGAAPSPKRRRLEPLSADRYGVHFTVDGEFRELLERVRGLAGHRLPNGDLMTLIKRGLEAYERELTKERFAVGRKPRCSGSVTSEPSAPTASDGVAPDRIQTELSTHDRAETELSTHDCVAPERFDTELSTSDCVAPERFETELSTHDRTQTELSTHDCVALDRIQTELSTSDGVAPDRIQTELSTSDGVALDRIQTKLSTHDRAETELSTHDCVAPDYQSNPNPKQSPNRKRHVPAQVARAVFLRDGRQCSYVSPEGRRCSAQRCLELDHVDPWAVGGEGTVENLRLRCRAHNQRTARQYFGKSRVDAAVRKSRQRRAGVQRPGKVVQL